MIEAETTTATVSPELLETMMENDESWIRRYIKGKWGIPGGQIHSIPDNCILQPNAEFISNVISRGNLSRVLDHGDAAPTCCLWFSAYKQWYFCYREYYAPDKLVSYHREQIAAMSVNEKYNLNLADPAIFKKNQQKYGGKWTTFDEYLDKQIQAPPLFWNPADNNEFATRNRISELLRPMANVSHPITGEKPAPRLYFIERTQDYPNGAYYVQRQARSQKREKVGTINGKEVFSDERDKNVEDHAYDCLRYYCASHSNAPSPLKPKAPEGSFFNVRKQFLTLKNSGQLAHLGLR